MWCSFTWIFMLSVLDFGFTFSQMCDEGWFGPPDCKYKCHCTSNTVCDVQTGTCTEQDSTCDKGWFGPACQYSDLAPLGNMRASDQSTDTITTLSDGDDNTCYTNTNVRSFTITWDMAYHFTWMRVVVNGNVSENSFTATFKNKTDAATVSCDNAIQWMVNSRTVDIHCDLSRTTQQVILSWDGDIFLCSVYVSGGRNIALKQAASQTSTAVFNDERKTKLVAGKAVDGVTEGAEYHCSATKLAAATNNKPLVDPNAAWSLTLSKPQLINRFVIYNTYPKWYYLLQSFSLKSFAQDNTTIFTYIDMEDPEFGVYTIIPGSQGQPVKRVQISAVQHGDRKAVPLCEVEIYGDNVCSPGTYGLDCEHSCKCAVDGETCFVSTGGCPSGCPAGLHGEGCQTECPVKSYGEDCKYSCSAQCLDQLCDRVDGKCDVCVPGKQGDFCEKDCDKGYYGKGCSQQCSQNCADDGSCKPLNGTCDHGCKPGYTTPQCNQTCGVGWFGRNCQYKCHCSNNTCDNVNGTCTEQDSTCEKGWFGPACQYSDLTPQGNVTMTDQSTALTVVSDGNDKTCYSSTGLRSVAVTWDIAYYFTWMRVVANDSVSGVILMATFKNETEAAPVSCNNARYWMVNSRTVDIHCDMSETNQQLILTWNRDISLCSVYISGGRNVALKQAATQTSTALVKRQTVYTTADKAVDGVTEFSVEHCSATQLADNLPDLNASWSVSLSRPQMVYRFLIYNRYKDFRYLLQGFTLTSFTRDNKTIFTYKDMEDSVLDVYTIIHGPQEQPVTRVQISVERHGNRKAVPLCEVEIYGESACDPGTYGLDCEYSCNCAVDGETCFISTGGCPSECPAGLHGEGCQSAQVQGDDDVLPIPLIAGVASAVVVVMIVVIAGIALWRRRQKPKASSQLENRSHKDGTESEISKTDAISMNLVEEPLEPDPRISSSVPYHNVLSVQDASTAIPVKDLNAFMQSHGPEYFKAQFQVIPLTNPSATMNVGLSPENKSKNRYKNICAYDHSRVTLQTDERKKEGDYINASYVEGYQNKERFIASQGPNKVILNDFIRMLWEQRVDKVVMLTNLVEEGKAKCERYWPEEGELQFGEISVNLAATQVFADYTIRKLNLKKGKKAERTLTHFHFTSWPDKGVPRTPWALVDFEQRVACIPTTQPIVVHCSAGVGRTGTFIALRNVMMAAEDCGQMDFSKTLYQLRMERVNMIQTLEQYIFLHKAAQVALVCMNTTVTSNDIFERIRYLETTSPTGQTYMDKEFDAIRYACMDSESGTSKAGKDKAGDGDGVYENNQGISNKQKNRYSNILPNDFYRPELTCEIPGSSSYINAVLVPGFTRPDNQILTQLPMPTTVLDLWRLVTQYNVSLMVAMELESASSDSTICNFLPTSDTNPVVCEPFTISGGPRTQDSSWDEQVLSISGPNGREHKLTHLKCNNIILSPESLLAFVTQIRSYSTSSNSRTLYMCKNGAAYSGLMCVLSLLMDRMDSDFSLTIPLVVGAIKAIRPQAIPSTEQYQTLYQVLKLYTASTGIYCNFGESGKLRPPSLATPQSQDSGGSNASQQQSKSTVATISPYEYQNIIPQPQAPSTQASGPQPHSEDKPSSELRPQGSRPPTSGSNNHAHSDNFIATSAKSNSQPKTAPEKGEANVYANVNSN